MDVQQGLWCFFGGVCIFCVMFYMVGVVFYNDYDDQ
jgi:hypothetical protein